jgi:hypothetical protein
MRARLSKVHSIGSPGCLHLRCARVQDIVTVIVYANRNGSAVDIYAQDDAALWSLFAAAVSEVPVSLHLENMPQLKSDADYPEHFNVPWILRAGGEPQTSANLRNWMECVRSRKTPNASIEAGYCHSIALCMNVAAIQTGEKVTFNDRTQQVIAGGKVYE